MDERLEAILGAVSGDTLAKVAAGAMGVSAAQPGPVRFEEILKPHADSRTIGIVRVSGTAVTDDGLGRPWSAVTKIIDKAVPPHWKDAVDPDVEVQVYERGLFTDTGAGLRPARCYHISRPSEAQRVLWLEDLTDAGGPPFSIEQLHQMARHIGQWNAATAAAPPDVGFPIGGDFQVRSWVGWSYPERAAELIEMEADPMVRAMYARQSPRLAGQLTAAFGQIVERTKVLPHGVGLADCPVSNFFHRPGETIAIDWAGLGNEPIGGDGGRFVGSALTWGRRFVDVAEHERELFESYATGASEAGYAGSPKDLRIAYLSQLGFYLNNTAILPTVVSGRQRVLSRDFFEKRFDMPLEAFGEAASRLIDMLPSYISETQELLG